MFWEKEIETLERQTLEQLQLKSLKKVITRTNNEVPFYREKFATVGLRPRALRELKDIQHVPFTTSADLRNAYPKGMLAVPPSEVVRLHTSSGTTGKPKALYFTRRDVDQAAQLIARCLIMSGITSEDVLQNMMTYGLFTGALVMHYGAEKIGTMVIPAGPGNSERQLMLMQDFRTTAFHTTPSYALYFADFLEKKGIDPRKELCLRKAFVGAEPYSEETCAKIESVFGIEVFNSYGLSEMNGPGVAFECNAKQGMHLWEDQYIMEVINPDTGESLPDGEQGELVLTTLCREAMPLLRYRTRDITSIIPEPCSCGRTHRRIRRITGRSDDMIIVRGANVYPQQIERVLMSLPGVGRNYLICLEGLDEMIIKVEVPELKNAESKDQFSRLEKQIVDKVRFETMVKPTVELVPSGSLPASEGKAKRVIDKRIL